MRCIVAMLVGFALGIPFWSWWTTPERVPSEIKAEIRPMEQKMFLVLGTDENLAYPHKAIRTTTYYGYLGLVKFNDPKKTEALEKKIKQVLEEAMTQDVQQHYDSRTPEKLAPAHGGTTGE